MATKGWGDDDVGAAYAAARSFEQRLIGESAPVDEATLARLRFEVGIGLWSHKLVRGRLRSAKLEANTLADIAGRTEDPSMGVVALRASGTTAFWLGQFADAERDLRTCLARLSKGSDYQPFATDLGVPPFSLVKSDLADALWALGRYREALDTISAARALAIASRNPFHECYTLAFSCWIKLKLRELESASIDAASLREQAGRFGLHALGALGRTLGGIVEASAAEDPRDGIGDTLVGLGEWKASGSALLVCYFHTEAASIWLRGGDARHAELELLNAFRVAKQTGERYYFAEMHRLRGEIKLLRKRSYPAAEADFRKAMEIATGQKSPTFRLRAAASLVQLSRVWKDPSPASRKRRIARCEHELAAILKLFDKRSGFADLRTARQLLAASAR
jgi:tetratricopeptide (TPR) repeat protein